MLVGGLVGNHLSSNLSPQSAPSSLQPKSSVEKHVVGSSGLGMARQLEQITRRVVLTERHVELTVRTCRPTVGS